jgi:hypothetical protein
LASGLIKTGAFIIKQLRKIEIQSVCLDPKFEDDILISVQATCINEEVDRDIFEDLVSVKREGDFCAVMSAIIIAKTRQRARKDLFIV